MDLPENYEGSLGTFGAFQRKRLRASAMFQKLGEEKNERIGITNIQQHRQQLRNVMVSRVVIYLLIMCLLKLCWCLEQPSSSLLEKHPLFAWLCKNFRIYKAPCM